MVIFFEDFSVKIFKHLRNNKCSIAYIKKIVKNIFGFCQTSDNIYKLYVKDIHI